MYCSSGGKVASLLSLLCAVCPAVARDATTAADCELNKSASAASKTRIVTEQASDQT